ncbi:hypothetical protein [Rhizobium deserti]|nr:hypothetical protein [Rhizobium deserti]
MLIPQLAVTAGKSGVLTKIDPLWGQDCEAVQLQALPSSDNLASLVAIQDEIEATAQLELRRIPAEALHCTILTLLHPTAQFDRGKFDIWNEYAERWTAAFLDVVADTFSFELTFDRIICSEMAIIVTAPELPVLQMLREKLANAVDYKGWHPNPPDIAHITLFRYAAEGPIPAIRSSGSLPFDMPVPRMRLIKESVYPTLQHQIVGEVVLA